MERFDYTRAESVETASRNAAMSADAGASPVMAATQYIAGGTNMTDYMKLGVMRPTRLVDLNPLALQGMARIEAGPHGLRLGALVRMAEAQDHAAIRRDYPVIAQSLMLAASQQIRNMASLGGNVLQRTRCEYFRETSWPCNKRDPGSGCAAMDGVNRQHAVLGTSDACIATYHGDFAQALIALDAAVDVTGPAGRRTLPFAALHRQPGDSPHVETVLAPGDVITAITVPAGSWTRRSRYVKVRDRDSYAFALASAAVALDLDGDTVRHARIGLGGVATVPWRAREAESALEGRRLDEAVAREAARIAFAGARAREHNAYKIPLGQRTLVRALLETRDMEI
ncbi:FAD binding domain-containing protein [Methyloraptor flagellatus]|uniref:Xanthine dehydrogenase family protein subunit M n=1 Tax=Methyloraptor flagellatus TaxID=3162530 RepID=A0AAU7XDD9_9HYPH